MSEGMSDPISRFKKLFKPHHKPENRNIYFNEAAVNGDYHFSGNAISTTKYTWLTFLPKGLYEQFRRSANLYFLFHCCISLTPVSPVSPITTILPLAFVTGVGIFKELYEDVQRGVSDKQTNSQRVTVLAHGADGGENHAVNWREVRVGDIVRVEANQSFPADLVCLKSSSLDGNCFVETVNLDGESNLKQRRALEETRHITPSDFKQLRGRIECEQPNASIYTFAGNLVASKGFQVGSGAGEGSGDGEIVTNLMPSHLLLRGSRLRNTQFAYGIAIFTGPETKVMMNSLAPPSKRSSMERKLDWFVLMQILALLILSTLTAIAFGITLFTHFSREWYMRPEDTYSHNAVTRARFDHHHPAYAAFLNFFTGLVLYGYFVPLALYVSVEVAKSVQALLISKDCAMFDEELNVGAKALTSNLNEELDLVTTLLSDKTGTLTRNQMDYVECSIGGVRYGQGATPDDGGEESLEAGFNMRDPTLECGRWRGGANARTIRRFAEVLSVCHTVVSEGPRNALKYQAESPDEAALVLGAKRLGLTFLGRDGGCVVAGEHMEEVTNITTECRYRLLHTLEFNSTRKRMSVVVRNPEGELLLFCKGADEVVLERLDPSPDSQQLREVTEKHLMAYAEAGLRTLAVAWKPLEAAQYEEWQVRWNAARQDVSSAIKQAEQLAELAEELERGMRLLGGTAVEDKLQPGVASTIQALAEAGIKLWVLTGDKVETAVNIAHSCHFITHDMVQHTMVMDTNQATQREASAANISLEEFCGKRVRERLDEILTAVRASSAPSALIIDGLSLSYVIEHPEAKLVLLACALECSSLLCCRSSPRQKAMVTSLVRVHGGQVCLAIGDGANDVGMIQTANVGVGIAGREGRQAVMSADFQLAQFRHLERLLLVHGGWSYRRLALLIKYFFYKNFAYGFTTFFFNCCAQFSGTTLYLSWYLSLFSVLFSSLPICVVACTDQDVPASTRLRFPTLHRAVGCFSALQVSLWMLNGLYQAAVAFVFVLGAYWLTSDRPSGMVLPMEAQGTTMTTLIILAINLQLALAVQHWTWLLLLAMLVSLASWTVVLLVLDALPPRAAMVSILFANPLFYLIIICAVVIMLLPDFVGRAVQRQCFPSDLQILQEMERKEEGGRMRRGLSGGGEMAVEMNNYHAPSP